MTHVGPDVRDQCSLLYDRISEDPLNRNNIYIFFSRSVFHTSFSCLAFVTEVCAPALSSAESSEMHV